MPEHNALIILTLMPPWHIVKKNRQYEHILAFFEQSIPGAWVKIIYLCT